MSLAAATIVQSICTADLCLISFRSPMQYYSIKALVSPQHSHLSMMVATTFVSASISSSNFLFKLDTIEKLQCQSNYTRWAKNDLRHQFISGCNELATAK